MKVYTNMSGLEFVVIEKLKNRQVKVQFLATGSVVQMHSGNMSAGKVSDPFHKSRLGVGWLGYFDKRKPYHKRAYQLWTNMIKRCYDPNDKRGYYGTGVKVSEDWLCYANFLEDLSDLEGFSNWLAKEGYDLDKDLRGCGKFYSRETCKFIPRALNRSLGKKGKRYVDGHWVTTDV